MTPSVDDARATTMGLTVPCSHHLAVCTNWSTTVSRRESYVRGIINHCREWSINNRSVGRAAGADRYFSQVREASAATGRTQLADIREMAQIFDRIDDHGTGFTVTVPPRCISQC